ncbi:ribosomal protein S18 acetylase RimI-like enzyme [Herbaspirillum sp. Sphag1AN]|uniref:GNAT family N-acetyltransferase/peptidase C39 family protein n=1 Tax=unclassified Herbaspirillum TaxID=2624150 RepID=UPI00160EF8F7|nr:MULTISPECIES: GNAT family N-acetyltransferase/peptidase C39 family protein [unclassified Herbaspirillum]MBB3214531.1 ribosomal protein S18 acetylase RimI-like enzyme [Herbaspirillum sp. Sphag1AN]MBB3247629.1 ribosomal protein S18 acetylase RimI-like enzyme [Herbaspirillum sp. Sphag64]
MIRAAVAGDIAALLEIENRSFSGDRISARSFRHLLARGHAATLLDDHDGQLRGYVTLLFRKNLSLARIYSIATHPDHLGHGVAAGLLLAAEQTALMHNCVSMRLEIRKDNQASLRLFQSRGYRIFGDYPAYYDDGMDGFRLEKSLTHHLRTALARAPYYQQTLGFTCGPACLMMAMKAFDPALRLDRTLELQLWREATTIFMTSGHGGCSPYGLALAAQQRDFPCEIFVNGNGVLFQESVRSPEKRQVIQLVHDDFVRQVNQLRIPVHRKLAGTRDLVRCFHDGGIPLVLISTYRLTRERAPHWVIMTGCDDRFFYIHDPDNSPQRSGDERINMAILKKDFERMARYGRDATKAMVILYPPQAKR